MADDVLVVFYLEEHPRAAIDQRLLTRDAVQVSTGGDSTPNRASFKIRDGGAELYDFAGKTTTIEISGCGRGGWCIRVPLRKVGVKLDGKG